MIEKSKNWRKNWWTAFQQLIKSNEPALNTFWHDFVVDSCVSICTKGHPLKRQNEVHVRCQVFLGSRSSRFISSDSMRWSNTTPTTERQLTCGTTDRTTDQNNNGQTDQGTDKTAGEQVMTSSSRMESNVRLNVGDVLFRTSSSSTQFAGSESSLYQIKWKRTMQKHSSLISTVWCEPCKGRAPVSWAAPQAVQR